MKIKLKYKKINHIKNSKILVIKMKGFGDISMNEFQHMSYGDSSLLDKDSLPDVDALLTQIMELMEFINTDEMRELEENNKDEFEKRIEQKFNIYESRYSKIYILLMQKKNRIQNLIRLTDICSRINEMRSGKLDMKTTNEKFIEEMNNEYVYSKFGGKEKFEETLKQRAEEKKIKEQKKAEKIKNNG